MTRRPRRTAGTPLLAATAQFVLLVAALYLESATAWTACLGLIALAALVGWISALRRRRAITDTPTSRIASAAQGYVEIHGRGRPFDDNPLCSPLTALPCLWYRFQVEEADHNNSWRTVAEGESDASVLVDDGSGTVLIAPDHAEIISRHKEVWTRDGRRYTEWKLLAGDPIYALGDFATIGGSHLELNADADLRELLGNWKASPQTLRQRFDLDGDGELSVEEWQLARAAARREVAAQHREARRQPDVHILRRPAENRPHLISNIDPERLTRRFGWWSAYHLAAFLAALAAIPRFWQQIA